MDAISRTLKQWVLLTAWLCVLPATLQALDEAAIQEEVAKAREWLKTVYKDKPMPGLDGLAKSIGRSNYLRKVIAKGDLATVRNALEEDLTLMTPAPMSGGTPLLSAVEANDGAMVKLIFSFKDELVRRGLVRSNHAWENEALLVAARDGQSEAVRALLGAEADREVLDLEGRTLLSLAVPHPLDHWASAGADKEREARRMATAKLLAERGANLFTVCGRRFPMTPLQAAVQTKNGAWVDLLLTNTTQLAATDADGNSLLHIAVTFGRDRALVELLAKSANVRATNHLGLTPLRQLASLPASINANMTKEMMPLHFHGWEDRQANADLLIARGATLDIFSAVALGRSEAADLLRQLPALVQERDAQGRTPLHWAASAGERGMVEILLKYRAPVQAQDRENRLPLHDALERRQFRIAERLLAAGSPVNVKDQRGRTPLHFAAESGQLPLVEQLLSVQADVKAVDERGKTSLHLAAEFGHEPIAKRLLDAGADINAKDKDGNTPLDVATRQNREPVVRLLVAGGSAIKTGGRRVTTPLHSAVVASNMALIQEMLKQEVDINAQNAEGKTALILACERDSLPLMDLLLNAGADINAPDKDGNTVLHYRMRASIDWVPALPPPDSLSGRISKKLGVSNPLVPSPPKPPKPPVVPPPTQSILKYLLDHKADVQAINYAHQSPLHFIAERQDTYSFTVKLVDDMVALLLANGAKVDAADRMGMTPLHLAAARPSYTGLNNTWADMLLKHNANPNTQDKSGRTPLLLAIKGYRSGPPRMISLLLTHKADVNLADHTGRTPLHVAAVMEGDKLEILTILLAQKSEVNAPDNDGRTPLHLLLTVRWPFPGPAEAIKLLLAAGAQVNAQDKEGRTPLHLLLTFPWPFTGVADAIDAMLAAGADVNVRDKAGRSAVHYVCLLSGPNHWRLQEPLATRIVTDTADINVADNMGNTPLHLATSTGRAELSALLISKKADATVRNEAGVTALYNGEVASPAYAPTPLLPPAAKAGIFQSAAAGDLASLEILLRADPKLAQITNQSGATPLLVAAYGGHQAAADRLLAAGAVMDPYSAAALGRVAELETALKQNPELIKRPRGNAGNESLLHRAVHSGQMASVKVLLDHQADWQEVDYAGHTPLYLALTNGHTAIVDLLRAKGARENIFDAVALNHPTEVKFLLLDSPGLVQHTNRTGLMPLHQAVLAGNREITELLISKGAPVNTLIVPYALFKAGGAYAQGLTALHLAAWFNRRDLAELLLAAGAETEIMEWGGYTPLHYASFYGYQAFAECLLTHKARVDSKLAITNLPPGIPIGFNGNTPLHLAALQGHTNLVELLLTHGANVNALNNQGHTPLSNVKAFIQRRSPYSFGESLGIRSISDSIGIPPQLVYLKEAGDLVRYPAAQSEVAALLLRRGAKEPNEPPRVNEFGFPRNQYLPRR